MTDKKSNPRSTPIAARPPARDAPRVGERMPGDVNVAGVTLYRLLTAEEVAACSGCPARRCTNSLAGDGFPTSRWAGGSSLIPAPSPSGSSQPPLRVPDPARPIEPVCGPRQTSGHPCRRIGGRSRQRAPAHPALARGLARAGDEPSSRVRAHAPRLEVASPAWSDRRRPSRPQHRTPGADGGYACRVTACQSTPPALRS